MSQDDKDHVHNVIKGVILGIIAGSGIGLFACTVIFDETLLFTGDTILVGAVVFGALGYYQGESFLDWVEEHLWRFW